MVKRIFNYLFSFKGKISQREYILPFIVFTFSIVILNSLVRTSDNSEVLFLFIVLLIISFSSFTVRRLEDINVSYIWMLTIFITPLFFLLCFVLCFLKSKKKDF